MRFLILLALFTSCTPNVIIQNFEKYKPTSQKLSDNDIKKIEPYEKDNLVILPLENMGTFAETQGIGKTITDKLKQTIKSNRYANIIERNIDKNFLKELQIAENLSDAKIDIPINTKAKYVIKGKILESEFYHTSHINPVFVLQILALIGSKHHHYVVFAPPTISKANLRLNVKIEIFDIEKMSIIKTIQCESKKSRIVPSHAEKDDLLLSQIVSECTNKFINQFEHFITPYSLISEKRTFKNKAIFKINIGKNHGLKMRNKVLFTRIYDEDFEKDLKITSGYISDMISDNSAWIIVKSSSDGNKVRIGDIANIILG